MNLLLDEIATLLDLPTFDEDSLGVLEDVIEQANDHARQGDPIVADAVYDRLVGILRRFRPTSPLLQELWESPDESSVGSSYASLLARHPMMSILTVKSWDSPDIKNFLYQFTDEPMSFHLSYKLDGHGVRVVYEEGRLVSATSRARASAGRDITNQMRHVIPEFLPELVDLGYNFCEFRGEIVLPIDKLDAARHFTPGLKSPFSAVASLIKPSATPAESSLLDFMAYGFYADVDPGFATKSEEYDFIQGLGLSVPAYTSVDVSGYQDFLDTIQDAVESFEEDYSNFGYMCDGIVLEVEDRQDFSDLGSEGNHNRGNLALKVDSWAQALYTAVIDHIDWKPGKTKLTPVAVIEPTLTENGATVTNIPLYNPASMYILDAYPGYPLSFRFGGEAGVVPCMPDGSPLTDQVLGNLLSQD